MRQDDTLTASAETRARLRVESTPFDYPWSSRQGDFAAGLRTQPLEDCTHGSFATGVAQTLLLGGAADRRLRRWRSLAGPPAGDWRFRDRHDRAQQRSAPTPGRGPIRCRA